MKQDRLTYPTERLVGIADGRRQVEAAVSALRDAGVADERIEVVTGETGEFVEDDDQGVVGRVTQVLKTAIGDETERLEHLEDALEAGRVIVQVRLTEDDDADREGAKRRLGRVLSEQGLAEVAFYGKWQIEEIQMGT